MGKPDKKLMPFRMKFLYLILACYALGFLASPAYTWTSLEATLVLFVKLIPILALVFAINLLVNRYVKESFIRRHIGEASGWRSVLYAMLAGMLISGPPYILYPMLGDLKKGGASDNFMAILLYNRNVKIPFIPVMVYYFGILYTVIISILIVIFSLLNGYLVSYFVNNKKIK